MDIFVCVKQVPASTNVEVDPVTGVIKRDGAASKLNPYDLYALEMALRLKERFGGTVSTLTMGPAQAKDALLETVYMGADHGFLLSDRAFAGSDVHASSYAISRGILKSGSFDLIICGKQTTDGDTAQVGPETAEWLGMDHASNVMQIGDVSDDSITVTMNMDDSFQTQKMSMPCLITIEKDVVTPRLPSYKRKKEADASENTVTVFTAKDLEGLELSNCGLKGSPTKVEKIFPPEKNTEKIMHRGSSGELAQQLSAVLKNGKFI